LFVGLPKWIPVFIVKLATHFLNSVFILNNSHTRNMAMKITLRKASALQNAINETVKAIDVSASVTVDEFQEANTVIEQARNTAMQSFVRKAALLDVLYAVRKSVAAANAAAGIADLLADVALLEKRIQLQSQLANATPRLEDAVLNGRLDRLREGSSEARLYRHSNGVDTGVFVAEAIADYRAELADLKKSKQALQDRLLELNVQTTVELDSKSVSVLTQEGLV